MENIINTINNNKPDIVYIAIGSALKWHPIETITANTNQQYPPFLNDYNKKIIILIDEQLENPLVLETKMELKKISLDSDVRIFNADNTIIFAINKNFYFSTEAENTFLENIIFYTLSNSTKLIVNDYSGRNIEYYYISLFDKYGKDALLNHVLYDITHNEGGCIINFDQHPILYDYQKNFIQIKYKTLTEIKQISEKHYKIMALKRINFITYELSRMIRVINGEITEDPNISYFTNGVKNVIDYISTIYSTVIKSDLSKDNIEEAMLSLLMDICISLEIDMDIINYLQTNNYKQKIVYDSLNPLKFLIGDI